MPVMAVESSHAVNPDVYQKTPTTRSRTSRRSAIWPTCPACWWSTPPRRQGPACLHRPAGSAWARRPACRGPSSTSSTRQCAGAGRAGRGGRHREAGRAAQPDLARGVRRAGAHGECALAQDRRGYPLRQAAMTQRHRQPASAARPAGSGSIQGDPHDRHPRSDFIDRTRSAGPAGTGSRPPRQRGDRRARRRHPDHLRRRLAQHPGTP